MSILKVDTINEKTTGNGVEIAHALKGSGIAGFSIQTVYNSYATQITVPTGGSFVDTGLSATITPKFNTSKILVLISQQYSLYQATSGSDIGLGWRVFRDTTAVLNHATAYAAYSYHGSSSGQTADHRGTFSIMCFDSPSTTSSITYKTQAQKYSSGTASLQNAGNHSEMVLMEIAQ